MVKSILTTSVFNNLVQVFQNMVFLKLIEDLGIPKKNRKIDILGTDMLGTVARSQSVSLILKRTGMDRIT